MSDKQQMVQALGAFSVRVREWIKEGAVLQELLLTITTQALLDDRPLTEEEQEWARRVMAEYEAEKAAGKP